MYQTPCNVGIYIAGYKISDAFRVDWDCRDSKTPLYGWADDTYVSVTKGRKIITGRLVINYTHPHYLINAIQEFTKQTNTTPPGNSNSFGYSSQYDASPHLLEYLERDGADRVKFLADLAAKNYGDERLTDLANAVNAIQANAVNATQALNHIHGQQAGTMPAALQNLLDSAGKPQPYQDNNTFDILVSYGDIMKEDHIETVIKDAYIVGQSQTISASATGGGDVSSSGSPIYEIYSFFAKEIVANKHAARDNTTKPVKSAAQPATTV